MRNSNALLNNRESFSPSFQGLQLIFCSKELAMRLIHRHKRYVRCIIVRFNGCLVVYCIKPFVPEEESRYCNLQLPMFEKVILSRLLYF